MKLAFVLSSLTLSGGVLLVLEYANRLAQRGHSIALVHPQGAVSDDMLAKLDAGVQTVAAKVALDRAHSLAGMLRLSGSLAAALPPAEILVATHTPTVVPVLLAVSDPRRGGARRRAWLYMDYEEMFRTRPIERFLLHAAPRHFDVIMAISQPLAVAAIRDGARRVVTTGAGLARADHFAAVRDPNLPAALLPAGSEARILYVGDNRPRKGLQEVLDAVRRLLPAYPRLRLVVVAKHPVSLPADLPCELHVHPNDDDLAVLYRGSDIFVSASWGEGLGYPPLEAMASSTPAVISDSGGIRDYARDGENCLLVPPRDAVALAEGIRRLLDEPALAARLVQGGLQTVQRYHWDAVIDRVEQALALLSPTSAA